MLEEAGQRKTGMTLSPSLHQREHLNSPIRFLFVFDCIAFRKNFLGLINCYFKTGILALHKFISSLAHLDPPN